MVHQTTANSGATSSIDQLILGTKDNQQCIMVHIFFRIGWPPIDTHTPQWYCLKKSFSPLTWYHENYWIACTLQQENHLDNMIVGILTVTIPRGFFMGKH
jgi:hypothetical protein